MQRGSFRIVRRWKRYRIDRTLTRVTNDLRAASRRQDRGTVSQLEVRIHELGWEKEKLL